jgi:hypothetical protein
VTCACFVPISAARARWDPPATDAGGPSATGDRIVTIRAAMHLKEAAPRSTSRD